MINSGGNNSFNAIAKTCQTDCDKLKYRIVDSKISPPLTRLRPGFQWVLASGAKEGPWCWHAMGNIRRQQLTTIGRLNTMGLLNVIGSAYCPEAMQGGKYSKRNKKNKRRTNKRRFSA